MLHVKLLVVFALIGVSAALRVCKSSEICFSERVCNKTDDSGIGKIGPRIDRECEPGKVCCDRTQLEDFINGRLNLAGVDGSESTTKAAVTSVATTKQQRSGYKICGQGKECVPRVLCNGTINDSGRYIITSIGARIGSAIDFECQPLEKCCDIGDELVESPFLNQTREFKPSGCGNSNPNGLFVDMVGYSDHDSLFGEFPWMIAVMGVRSRYLCGGVLIHPSLVLTAAHCLEKHTPDDLVLRAGEWDSSTEAEPLPHQNTRVKQMYIHEEFDNLSFFNDIALLVVETPFTLQPHIQPICLPDVESDEGYAQLRRANCIATGWGRMNYNNNSLHEVILKRIELPIVAHDECQAMLRSTILGQRFRLRPSFICAGGELGKDTCKGDGGSPLFCTMPDNENRYVLAGIVSWGIGCGLDGIPGVYANIPHLRKWIDDKVKGNNFSIN